MTWAIFREKVVFRQKKRRKVEFLFEFEEDFLLSDTLCAEDMNGQHEQGVVEEAPVIDMRNLGDGFAAVPGMVLEAVFGARGIRQKCKIIAATANRAAMSKLKKMNVTVRQALRYALFDQYATPFGSSAAALDEARAARDVQPSASELDCMVARGEVWFGLMADNGIVFAGSRAAHIERTFYDERLVAQAPQAKLNDGHRLYGGHLENAFFSRNMFVTFVGAAARTTAEEIAPHRMAVGELRQGRPQKLPSTFSKVNHSASDYSCDVILPMLETGDIDFDGYVAFGLAEAEPRGEEKPERVAAALRRMGEPVQWRKTGQKTPPKRKYKVRGMTNAGAAAAPPAAAAAGGRSANKKRKQAPSAALAGAAAAAPAADEPTRAANSSDVPAAPAAAGGRSATKKRKQAPSAAVAAAELHKQRTFQKKPKTAAAAAVPTPQDPFRLIDVVSPAPRAQPQLGGTETGAAFTVDEILAEGGVQTTEVLSTLLSLELWSPSQATQGEDDDGVRTTDQINLANLSPGSPLLLPVPLASPPLHDQVAGHDDDGDFLDKQLGGDDDACGFVSVVNGKPTDWSDDYDFGVLHTYKSRFDWP